MLGKLIKYELRATAAAMLPILGVMLLMSALTNVGSRIMDGRQLPAALEVVFVLVIILFVVGLVAIGFVTVYMMVRRFRDNLLRDEGYIMHTLPVSVHAQIWSKVLVSALWYALTGITVVLSVLLVAFDAETVKILGDFFGALFRAVTEVDHLGEMFFEILALMILSSVVLSLTLDAALAVGHSFASRKMLISECVFVALIVLSQIAVTLISRTLYNAGLLELMDNNLLTGFSAWRIVCAYAAALLTAFGAICYAVTAFFLKRRLNLE